MIHTFPQLQSGSLFHSATYSYLGRSASYLSPDGFYNGFYDKAGSCVEWQLHYDDLVDAEVDQLIRFHSAVRGRLKTFRFFQPNCNLLVWSTDLSKQQWSHANSISVSETTFEHTPGSKSFQIINTSQVSGSFSQEVSVPGKYLANFSVWVRGEGTAVMFRQCSSIVKEKEFQLASQWTRQQFACSLETEDEHSVFGISLGANCDLVVAAPQVVCQIAPGDYVPSSSLSGICNRARFASDQLSITSWDANRHSAEVTIICPTE